MRIFFLLILSLHGLIHLLGFAKAFQLAPVSQLAQPIGRGNGLLWLTAACLFLAASILFLLRKDSWWMPAAPAMLLSQYLILTSWQDARFGTIANVIALIGVALAIGAWSFARRYSQDVAFYKNSLSPGAPPLLTEADIAPLPALVRNYIRYSGALNQPRVGSFRIDFEGSLRQDTASPWMPFESEQHNFLGAAVRLFYLKAVMKGLPVAGLHSYKNGEAFMDIRLLSLFKVQYQSGKEMGIAETVTFFNDMCLVPGTLIDKRIKWLEADRDRVKAQFTNNGITVSAWLHFDGDAQLSNFVTDDRYATLKDGTMKQVRWSTPITQHKVINGCLVPAEAQAIYHYPEGDFCYGRFRVKNVEYNVR